MPVAIPARSFGTTLTDSPSISPHGMPAPTPIASIGAIAAGPAPPRNAMPSHTSPAAATMSPSPEITPADSQRVSVAATNGTTSIGAEIASISQPASISLKPSMPMKRSGSTTSSTM
ncbi:hypothetical protein BSE24067_03157 [Burkholderia seminalis]|nr:hypothetical protein BSE24067_03157 [Burkholderia seminalis]